MKTIKHQYTTIALPTLSDNEIKAGIDIGLNRLGEINELIITDEKERYIIELLNRIDKAIEILKLCNSQCAKETIEILKGGKNDE